MTQHVPRDLGQPMPEEFFDSIQEMLSGAAVNFRLRQLTSSQLRLDAGAGHDQVSLSVTGAWRYVTGPVTGNHPGGAAGLFSVYVTTQPNQAAPLAGPAGGDHSFALALLADPAVPAAPLIYRRVGFGRWNGDAIVQFTPTVGPGSQEPGVPIGSSLSWDGSGDPIDARFLLRDGRLVNRSDYPELDAICGGAAAGADFHRFNGGIDPGGGKLRIGDRRGRVGAGADNMGQGAANRLTTGAGHPNLAGQSGGAQSKTLATSEIPSHGHAVTDPGHAHTYDRPGPGGAPGADPGFTNYVGEAFATNPNTTGISIQNTGGGGAFSLAQPYEVTNVIVRVK